MNEQATVPVYRIETERLVIRCYNPSDAPLFHQSIIESLDHLRTFMPWTRYEPGKLQDRVEKLRSWRSEFDRNDDFAFGIFNKEETELIGSTGLHLRIGKDAREIGYWVNVNHTNKGIATEVAAALTKVGFEILELKRIEIHCDPRNKASARVPEKLGYEYEGTLKKRFTNSNYELYDIMIWTLFNDTYESSKAKDYDIRAFDAIGREFKI